uniref:Vitamin K-dependent protein C n=1 Tax=Poecilia reticulata TaxID=8081 RepID=A0A3P9P482_POERE
IVLKRLMLFIETYLLKVVWLLFLHYFVYFIFRIIGGNDAAEHTIPWQAFINVGYSRGGGMIIADRWILTAAHMVVINGQIYLGLADVPQILETPSLNATAVHVHRQYNNPNGLNYDHDIALIKLKDPVTFKAAIMPLCLPSKNDTYDTGMMGLVSGFGITDKGNYLRFLTNKLKYVHIPVVEQQRCSNSLRGTPRTKKPILTDNMFCAGTPEGGKDSCIGDDGSGFTLQSENGRFWAAGIVSWGFRCGQKGTYGFYTKVANYVDWINKIMVGKVIVKCNVKMDNKSVFLSKQPVETQKSN